MKADTKASNAARLVKTAQKGSVTACVGSEDEKIEEKVEE